jgi:hypothetical protein
MAAGDAYQCFVDFRRSLLLCQLCLLFDDDARGADNVKDPRKSTEHRVLEDRR